MRTSAPAADRTELQRLLEFTARVGNNSLLTQASTGNCSTKLGGVLWIKASGKWMADAMCDDIFIPLDLSGVVKECLSRGVDPAERYPNASLETAVHAALPHRVVLHLHSVNTIAWAVRKDAVPRLQLLLTGLRWQWIPYAASGLPLCRAIERARRISPDTDLFVLGNHGLVIGGEKASDVEDLLMEVERRLEVVPRQAPGADLPWLAKICDRDAEWVRPEDDGVHALGTDAISRTIIAGGLLYPCQAIFVEPGAAALFRPIHYPDPGGPWQERYRNRLFLIIEGRGVVVNRCASPAELAMLSGLAQVVQRLSASAPLRYLTTREIAEISSQGADRYRGLAKNRADTTKAPAPSASATANHSISNNAPHLVCQLSGKTTSR